MRDHWARINAKAQVFGVSCDSLEKQQEFLDSENLKFPLISDQERDIVRKYDAGLGLDLMGGKLMVAKRVSIIIDEVGVVEKVIDKVSVASHGEDLLEALRSLAKI